MTDPGAIIEPPEGAADRLVPPTSPAAEPFWAATRDRQLVIQWCRACNAPIHYPRDACPSCLGEDLEFRPSAGTGTIYALSVMPVPGHGGMAGRNPYAVALVDLADGVRLLSNVLGDGAAEAAVGSSVAVAWEALPDGRHLPVFVLV